MSEALLEKQKIVEVVAQKDDTHTWLAEVLDGQMRSEFSYNFDGEDLIARDGRALGPIFKDAIKDAETRLQTEPGLAFELRRRRLELDEYNDMLAMAKQQKPNTMIVVSDFPAELFHSQQDRYGYNISRMQTMLRVVTRNDQGDITVVSQSLDGSNRAALEAIYTFMGAKPEPGELLGQRIHAEIFSDMQTKLPETLTKVHDQKMELLYGGSYFAGRRSEDRRNTMDFASLQSDLIGAYLAGSQDDEAKYKLAAAVTARFENRADFRDQSFGQPSLYWTNMSPIIEMELRGREAMAEGKIFSGCGGSISMNGSAESELVKLGYGDKSTNTELSESDNFGPLTFECQRGHRNKRPRGKLIECCKTCGVSVKC